MDRNENEREKLMRQGEWEACLQHYVEVFKQERHYCCSENRSLECDGNKMTCKLNSADVVNPVEA